MTNIIIIVLHVIIFIIEMIHFECLLIIRMQMRYNNDHRNLFFS